MKYNITVIPGDGIGVECTQAAQVIMEKISKKYGHVFSCRTYDAGGIAIDKYGTPLPDETLQAAKKADSVLLGAVGGPKWEHLDGIRPEQALLGLRAGLGLYINLRPALLFDTLVDACPLKPSIVKDGLDLMIVRELTGGIYFGKSGRDGDTAFDTETYSAMEIRRIFKAGIDTAKKRGKNRLTLVDKANILETSRLWREIAAEELQDHPEIQFDALYVDNAAMQLIRNPQQFDTIVTSNMFGDILSDEAAMLTGSIGMLPSASLGAEGCGMYEPVHGSAPDIAGKNIANPTATILSCAMMLRYSFALEEEANAIENAVRAALSAGARTMDIGGNLSTNEMTVRIAAMI